MRPDRAERIHNPPSEIQERLSALRSCQRLIEDLTQRLRSAEEERDRLEAELAPYRASIAPVQDCPPEVLSMIFEYGVGRRPQRIRSLMLVCRTWCHIAVNNSRLWTNIPISFDADGDIHRLILSANQFLLACCRNSGCNLLNLTLDFSDLLFNFKYGVITKGSKSRTRKARQPIDSIHFLPFLMDGCQDLITRCQSIDLTFPDSDMLSLDIWRSLLFEVPNLISMSIHSAGQAYNVSRQTFIGGFKNLCRLRSLTVDAIPDMNFLTLDHAGIEDMEICTDLGRSGTLQLDRFTGLKTLTILYTSHRWSSESALPTETLNLLELRALLLIGNFTSISRIRFTVPNLERIYIQQTSGDTGIQPDLPNVDAPNVAWSNLNCETGLWSHGSHSQLRRVLMHFKASKVLTIPARNKKVLIGILEKFRKEGSMPGMWKKFILEDDCGETETIGIGDFGA
jgi:F-box-like